MAKDDPKKPKTEPDEVVKEFVEALEEGLVTEIKYEPHTLEDSFTLERVQDFLIGEATFGELMGMTVDEAYAMAEFGYRFFQDAKYDDARKVFEGLIACNPYDPYFHAMLAAVYTKIDLFDEALDSYETALKLDDTLGYAHVNRAELLLQKGKVHEATEHLQKAIKLDPDEKEEATSRAKVLASAVMAALKDIVD